MKTLRQLLAFFRRNRLEAEMAEEMRLHLEQRTREKMAEGVPPEEAHYAALRRFGGIDQVKESCRDLQRGQWITNLARDAQYGTRQLLKSPGFTAVITLTLALGIGAVVAIFTAADDLLFRPLPFREPARLFRLWESNPARPGAARSLVSADNFLDWKARNSVFADMAAYYEARSVLYEGDDSAELHVQGVTSNFFTLLGVEAIHGQLFVPSATGSADEDADHGLIISHRLWQGRYGGDPGVIGRTVRLDAISGVIVGVTPPGFSCGDRDVDLWLSLDLKRSYPKNQGRDLNAIGRLKPEVHPAQAQAQLVAIARALEREDRRFNQNWSVTMEPLRDSFTGNVRTSLLVLLGAVSLLLLTACGNAANLLVARHLSRRSEMAVRAALGASRWRLAQQLLVESLLLALVSGLVGLAFGRLALAGLVALAPQALTQNAAIEIDLRVVLMAVGLSTLTGISFGLAPAWLSTRIDVAAEIKTGGRTTSAGGRTFRLWLIAGEIAASVILLTGGCLLLRSLVKLQAVDSGLHAGNVLTFHVRVPSPENTGLFAQSIEKISGLPGVRSASATSFLPFAGPPATTRVSIQGRPAPSSGEGLVATVRTVLPRYFATVGIPIRRGRDFDRTDNAAGAPLRFVVNEAFVRQYFSGEEPLGRAISTSMARTTPYGEIIGITGDVKEGTLRQQAVPTIYYPYGHMTYGQMNLVIRTDGDPMGILPAVRRTIHELDPAVPVADARSLQEILGETYERERFSAILMGGFSLIALLLAAIGIYGILAYSVAQRAREIGIRVALGAPRRRIVRMILTDATRFVVPGLLAGMAGAWGVTRFLANLLYETRATDTGAFLFGPAILLVVALLAAYLPARRAAGLNPLTALRLE